MNDTFRMFLILTGVTALCGTLLACVNELTSGIISEQRIRYVSGPAIQTVLAGTTNDPVSDRKEIVLQGKTVTIYEGKKDTAITGIAFETQAPGYAGPVSVISGFNPITGVCQHIAVATSNETPGVGSKIKDQRFIQQFSGLKLTQKALLKNDGGPINAISGATISSRAVCNAVVDAQTLFASYIHSMGGHHESGH